MVPMGLLVGGWMGTHGDAHPVRAIVLTVFLLQGCAVLADKRVVAGCQLADGYTTKQALDRGAVEANPILGNMGGRQIMTLKAVIAALLLWVMPETKDMSNGDRFLYSALSVLGCGAAMHNNRVQR